MAIEKTYMGGTVYGGIQLGNGFDLQSKAPLDSRDVVPEYAGLQALIDGNAAYQGMIVYDEETKKTYQAHLVDGSLIFEEFSVNLDGYATEEYVDKAISEIEINAKPGADGKDGISATHSWNGTVLTITSASGTSSADLKGEKGDAGADGRTPVKGTDYFTDTDKDEMISAVLAALPIAEGVGF